MLTRNGRTQVPGQARDEKLRRLREAALAACAVWLVLENAALLAFVPWHLTPQVTVVGAALYKVAFWFGLRMWAFAALALMLGVLWAYSARGARMDRRVAGREVRRG
jgi:hypothetical protein